MNDPSPTNPSKDFKLSLGGWIALVAVALVAIIVIWKMLKGLIMAAILIAIVAGIGYLVFISMKSKKDEIS